MTNMITPTTVEKAMREQDFIVSKTDATGRIVYGNEIFIEFSGYREDELLGAQQNIIRHPDMPRGVFRYLWQHIAKGEEVFAYIKNMAKDGSYYWVLAHVTPDYDAKGAICGYLSVRRAPKRSALPTIEKIYAQMRDEEARAGRKNACDASLAWLAAWLKEQGVSYEEYFLTI